MIFLRPVLILLALALSASPAMSETQLLALRTAEQAKGWEAVGRVLVGNRASCSGALIAPDVVLTAAHCLYLPGQEQVVAPAKVVFLPEFRNGRASAEHAANAVLVHQNFDFNPTEQSGNIASDLALIRLATAVSTARVNPFETAPRPRKGAYLSVVSYGEGRQEHASLQDDCRVLARRSGVLVMDCDVVQGSSGAPVFSIDENGTARIVSVISSASEVRGRPVALGTDLERPLSDLMQELANVEPQATAPSKPKVRRMLQSNSSTAKFVRP